ncbi:tetratricopeptide repeat protein [uncultured Lacinutrix sp.]|uniref:tetratricopeptide repeat protein n=1 Tax=uncultured Lacinutrix sp. TaxID=574032 RepID=UPI00261B84B6|nr:tetratricopeptide repeat protein [uncultured Lacinutrix sp.]
MKKQLILSLAVMVTFFSFAQKKELKMLEKAVKNNNYAEAKTAASGLESMVDSMDDKMKDKYYFNKAKAYFANGAGSNQDVMEAVKSLKNLKENTKYKSELAELNQLMQNDFLQKANTLYTNKKFKEAAMAFENLHSIVPTDDSYLYYAAVSAVNAQDFDLALKHYSKLKESGYTGVETVYYATNKETGEEEVLSKATRDLYVGKLKTHINPGTRETESRTAEITKNVALIYVNQGKTDKALAAIKDARDADPNDTALIITEANVQLKLGNNEAYSKLIKEATEKEPNNKDLLYNLGVLSAEAGNIDEAKAYYEKVITLDPNYANALTNIAALILEGENKIVKEMNGLGSSAKDDRRYDELKGKRQDLYKSAIPYLEKVLDLDNKNTDVVKTLMNIYSAINQNDKAKALKIKYGL